MQPITCWCCFCGSFQCQWPCSGHSCFAVHAAASIARLSDEQILEPSNVRGVFSATGKHKRRQPASDPDVVDHPRDRGVRGIDVLFQSRASGSSAPGFDANAPDYELHNRDRAGELRASGWICESGCEAQRYVGCIVDADRGDDARWNWGGRLLSSAATDADLLPELHDGTDRRCSLLSAVPIPGCAGLSAVFPGCSDHRCLLPAVRPRRCRGPGAFSAPRLRRFLVGGLWWLRARAKCYVCELKIASISP